MSGNRRETTKAPLRKDLRRERLGAELRRNLAKRKQMLRRRDRVDEDMASVKQEMRAPIAGS
jgi:hypothetical protein